MTDHSVRFNSYRTGRGFYRLPPLPIMYDSKTGKEITYNEANESGFSEEEGPDENTAVLADPSTPVPTQIWDKARAAVDREDLAKAEELLREYLTLTVRPTVDEEPEKQSRRNSAYDMLDALTALHQGSKVNSVKAYVDARYEYDGNLTQAAEEQIAKAPFDRNLQDNWDYLRAAILYSKQMNDDALKAFEKHQSQYPHSEKNESAIYMAAKLRLELSVSFKNTECVITGKNVLGKEIDPTETQPKEQCQDENWHAAVKGFQHLMQKYPKGRYFNDSRGWLAYLYRRGGETSLALVEYYRLLGDRTDWNARIEAKKSLQMLGHEYEDDTLDNVEEIIGNDANTAMAYAYHRIYNYAIDLTYQKVENWYSDDYEAMNDRKSEVAIANDTGKHELARIVSFATAMMKRYPASKVSAGFVLRIAEAQLELQNHAEALIQARKALSMGLQGELRVQALWIKGSCEHQAKDLKAARATFNELITEFPQDKLTEGARRLLALTAEDQNDLETALEQYLVLNYEYDVAYFVDVLLPTDRLANFVAGHPALKQHNYLLYALGVRYMRDKRWDKARIAFRRVETKYVPQSESSYDVESTGKTPFPKQPDWNDNENGLIRSSWVMQDMKTIDTLEHLERLVESAQGDEAKAEAMYQLASYQFDADSLLFYNPAAWQGQRSELLSQLDVSGSMRLPNESQIVFEYSQSHETLARAIPIYQEIVDQYPKTKAAKDAIFSAAVAHERLSGLNNYWREIYARGLFAGTKMVNFTDISALYPHFRWPRSRSGWEASTRTVSGGPAYPPSPKPAPKLTREQKIRGLVSRLYNEFQPRVQKKADAVIERYDSSVRSILNAVLAAIGLMIGGYGFLLWVHFYKPNWLAPPSDAFPQLAAGTPLEKLHTSESRMEKVIGSG